MNKCPYCQKPAPIGDVKCKSCGGWFTEDADQKQEAIDKERQETYLQGTARNEKRQLFYIPEAKLILACLLSFGLYELYWFYRNWKMIRDQEQARISPFWRSIFSALFCYNFFKRVLKEAGARGYDSAYTAAPLAFLYIGFTLLFKLPSPWDQLEILTFIPLVLINPAIRYLNRSHDPAWVAAHKFNKMEIFWIISGMFFWVGAISEWKGQ